MSIEDTLRAAAAKGMTHLTLYPVQSDDGKTTYWHARATPSTGHSYVQTTSRDPVEAVEQVLLALPKAPKRAKIDPHRGTRYDELPHDSTPITGSGVDLDMLAGGPKGDPGEPDEVTATVKPAPYPKRAKQMAADNGITLQEQPPEDMNTWLPKT